ncbi:MAG: hypothetical protein AUJ04_04985 [Acidobacteria bacterium 13_1_40CM_3_55_6]|nr:MAG: hypothetical protein AUJ04_04985 [Acidobacteria bacterium 13_1_40CM_3_55_6]
MLGIRLGAALKPKNSSSTLSNDLFNRIKSEIAKTHYTVEMDLCNDQVAKFPAQISPGLN